jgi:inhibitor of cysteine peptidase
MCSKYHSFLLLVLVLTLSSACSSPKTVSLTIADKGNQLNINVGTLIIITLDGNPSTGYTWESKDLDTVILEQVGDPVFNSNSPGQVGSGGTLSLSFKALQPGKTTLTLVYHRPWETGIDPLDSYTLIVSVK